jgi:hypothetical protein
MEIGKLEIQLLADIARLRTDMGNAQKVVGDSMRGIEGAIGTAKKAFAALGAVVGVASFGSWLKSAIDAGDEALKMSQKLGVSTKEVAGLQLAFNLAGVSTEAMEKGLVKLSVQVANNSKTLQAFGIETKNADGSIRSTSAVLKDVADRFAGMQDGAQKTALAVQLFGKAGADMIPLLNAGSAGLREMDEMARKLGLQIDEKTARAAEQFNDTLELMGKAVSGVARQAVAEIMPALTNMAAGMLKAMTEGDALKTAAQALGIVLKTLFTGVMAVAEGLNTVATVASATWRAFMAATNGDFSKAADIVKQAATDVASGWKTTSEIVAKTWSNQSDSALVATATIVGAQRRNADAAGAAALAAEENAKAAKKAADEYKKLTDTLDKHLITAQAEIETGGKLTDAKKLELDIRAKLNDQTLKLTASQKAEIETKLAAATAALNDRDAQREAEAARKKLSEAIGKQNEDLVKQIQTQQKANAESDLTTEQIARLEIQRLRDAAATAQQNAQLRLQSGINDDITKQYLQQAENLGKLADEKEKGVHIKAATEARDAWQKTTQSIYDGLTDALMRAFESGKGFMEAFKQTLKNAFKTLVLEPTIRAVMGPISGALGGILGGAPGVAGAATGGGGGSGLLGSIGSIAGIGGMIGSGLGYGLAAYSAGGSILGSLAGAGSMLSGGLAAGSLGSIAAGLGAVVGTLGPIALGIGLLVKGFSRGPKQTTATGIEGTIGGGEVDARQFADWIKKGGWFRSDKRGTDYSSISAETAAALDQTAAAVFNQARTYADAIGLSADALASVQTRIRVQLGKDEAENEKAIAAAFEQYRESLAASLGDALIPFQKAGETLAETLERLAQISSFSNDINQLGGIFSRVAELSVSAKEELIGFAGGIEAFLAKTQAFVQNYYSQEEQFGLQARQIKQALESIGITGNVSSREEFRRIVEAVDVTTTEGRKQLDALLSLAQAFAPLGAYLEEQGKTLEDVAEAAPQVAILKSILEDAEVQTEWAEKQTAATDRVYDGLTTLGDIFENSFANQASAIEALRASVESGLAQVASNTAATSRLLDSWDNNGSMATSSTP